MENNEEHKNEPNLENHQDPQPSSPPEAPAPPIPPVPLTPPSPYPPIAPQAPVAPAAPANNPAVIILQWLTYAFWGWTILAMSFLTFTVMDNFLNGSLESAGSYAPYAVAAVLVLLPISFVCDMFYSKQEPERKTGAASVVMILHAVLFAIFGIGALISIVISLVMFAVSSSSTKTIQVELYTELIIAIFYAAVFLRTLRPARFAMFRRIYPIFMVVSVGIIAILGLIGPVNNVRVTKNDNLIDNNLPNLQSDLNNQAAEDNKLPASLHDISNTGGSDEQKLIDSNLVTYIPNTLPPDNSSNSGYDSNTTGSNTTGSNDPNYSTSTFYYKLCVTYKKATPGYSSSNPSDNSNGQPDANGYSAYFSTDSHPAGYYCYKGSTN